MEFIKQENELVARFNNQTIGRSVLQKQNDQIFRLVHVFVEPEFRGQGIAGKLVFETVQWATKDHFYIIPVCPFAVTEFKRHAEYQTVLPPR